jgi:hypothetical protein
MIKDSPTPPEKLFIVRPDLSTETLLQDRTFALLTSIALLQWTCL